MNIKYATVERNTISENILSLNSRPLWKTAFPWGSYAYLNISNISE